MSRGWRVAVLTREDPFDSEDDEPLSYEQAYFKALDCLERGLEVHVREDGTATEEELASFADLGDIAPL